MRFLLGLTVLALSIQVHAKELRMAVITSEFDKNVTDNFLETDDQNRVHSMRYVTRLPNGGIFEDVSIPAETVIKEGAVIVERNGHEAVRLEVENFSLVTGGTVKLNYLYNGVTGTRQVKKLSLKLDKEEFKLFDLKGNRVNRMYLEANRARVLGIIGVKQVITSYQEEPTP